MRFLTIVTLGLLAFLLTTPALAFDMEAKTLYGQGLITLPMGDFGDFAGTGFGAVFGVAVPHDEKLSFRGELGYIMYGGKDFGFYDYSFSMIPIMALAEYQFSPGSKAYGVGGLGITMVCSSFEGSTVIMGQTITVDESDSSAELTIALGGGYRVTEKVDIEGRYNIISDTNYLSVHANIHF